MGMHNIPFFASGLTKKLRQLCLKTPYFSASSGTYKTQNHKKNGRIIGHCFATLLINLNCFAQPLINLARNRFFAFAAWRGEAKFSVRGVGKVKLCFAEWDARNVVWVKRG